MSKIIGSLIAYKKKLCSDSSNSTIIPLEKLSTPLNTNLIGHVVSFRDPYKPRTCVSKVTAYNDGRHILSGCSIDGQTNLTPYTGWRKLQDYHDDNQRNLRIYNPKTKTLESTDVLRGCFPVGHRRPTGVVDDHFMVEARRSTH